MPSSIDRARVWLEQGRHDRSEDELRSVLAEDPGNAQAHALLSLTLVALDRAIEAEEEARATIAADPELPLGHYALAVALEHRGLLDKARAAIDETIRITPRDANAWSLLGRLHIAERRWEEARRCAEHALAIDPELVGATNLRARALMQLGRKADADASFAHALSRDPENAATHTNVGLSLLQRGAVEQAQEHFREALRLEPDHELARAGLLESIKARNRFYRGMLAFFFWMGRQQKRTVWLTLVLLYLIPRGLNALARRNPALEPYVLPVVLLFAGFAILTWILEPLFNIALLFHPIGRYALNRRERAGALVVASSLLCAVLALSAGVATGTVELGVAGFVLLFFCLPLSGTFGMDNPRRRRVLAICTAALGAIGIAAGVLAAFGGEAGRAVATASVALILLGIFIMSWVVNRWNLDSRTD